MQTATFLRSARRNRQNELAWPNNGLQQTVTAVTVRACARPAPAAEADVRLLEMVNDIPDKIWEHFKFLDDDLSWLNLRWKYYEHLRWIMIDNLILSICRMMEQPKTLGKDNITFWTLCRFLRDAGVDGIHKEYEERIKQIDILIEPFRKHRHKRIVHSDLNASLSADRNPLPDISVKMIDDVLSSFAGLMNIIHIHATQRQMIYDLIVSPYDANMMVETLKRGMFFTEILIESPLDWLHKYESSRWYKA